MTAVGKFLKVGTTTVVRCVKIYARKNYAKPIPGSAVVVEIDEMWHFLKKILSNLDVEGLLSRFRAAHPLGVPWS